jgi:hypothetical protein
MFIAAGSAASAAPAGSKQNCRRDLTPTEFDSQGNETDKPGYRNSFEEDRARITPGPDEVKDRNPEERDARDPGEF